MLVVIIIIIIIVYLTIYWREPISRLPSYSFSHFISFISSFIYFILHTFAFSLDSFLSDKDYKHFLHSNKHSRQRVCVCLRKLEYVLFSKVHHHYKACRWFLSVSYLYSLSVLFFFIFLFYTQRYWKFILLSFVVNFSIQICFIRTLPLRAVSIEESSIAKEQVLQE